MWENIALTSARKNDKEYRPAALPINEIRGE